GKPTAARRVCTASSTVMLPALLGSPHTCAFVSIAVAQIATTSSVEPHNRATGLLGNPRSDMGPFPCVRCAAVGGYYLRGNESSPPGSIGARFPAPYWRSSADSSAFLETAPRRPAKDPQQHSRDSRWVGDRW